jgi:TP901 family phage tail tape measure protein
MAGRKIFELFGSIVIEGMGANKKALTQLDKDIRASNKALNKMGRDATKVGKMITKSLTVPLLGAGAAAVKFGADFDDAMTSSLAIMGDVSAEMRKELELTAREVAKTTEFSATQAAEAYYFLASAGLDAAQSMALLPKVAAFAQAGNFDLAKATDLLTDSQSALGLSSEDNAEHMENMVMISDQFVRAAASSNASVEEFSEGMTNKAGVALKNLNKDMSEGLAVMQVYADKGLAKGADAGTQLNIVLRDLQIAAVNNKSAFDQAGVAVFDADGKMNHIADIVEALTGRLGGMSDEQKRAELMLLGFTSKSVDATSALLGTSDAIREFEDDLKNGAITTQGVADKQMKTFWKQLGLVKDQVIDLTLTLFDGLVPVLMDYVIPAFKSVTEVVSSMLEWLGKHKNIATFVASFVSALAVMGSLVLLFVKFLPLIKSAVALYKVLTTSQVALNTAMSANPIGLIVVGMAALIAAGVLFWKNLDSIKKMFISTWDTIKFHFDNVASDIALVYNSLILGILEGIRKIGKFLPGISKGLDSLISTMEKTADVIAAEKEARIALHKAQEANKKMTEDEKKAVDDAANSLNEINSLISSNTAEKKKNTAEKEKSKQKTLEEIEAAEKLAEKRKKFEDDWSKALIERTATRSEQIAIERKEALAEAEKLGADKQKILEFYADEEEKLEKVKSARKFKIDQELSKAEADLQNDDLKKLKIITQQKLRENEYEKNESIKIATEQGLSLINIMALYKAREDKIIADSARKEIQIAEAVKAKKVSIYKQVMSGVTTVVDGINAIWQDSLNKRLTELEIETEAQKVAVENSLLTEEEKALRIAEIDKEADAKKLELQKENAKREKLAAIMGIILNTAMAVSAALTLPPPASFIMAGITAALGVAQLAIAIATPIPFADGGLVKADPGTGIIAQIGEGKEDEMVLPMKTGAAELAKNLVGKLGTGADSLGGGGMARVVQDIHLHIGTLIADNFGKKQLAKEIKKYIVADNQRTGVVA